MNAGTEAAVFGRWQHWREDRLHWRRAGMGAALCGSRPRLGHPWQAPDLPLDLLRLCPECAMAMEANLRDALTCSMVLPTIPATAGRHR